MPVAVCPGCRARYKVPEAAAGKKTTCKKCGQAFRIPASAPPAQASAPVAKPPASDLNLVLTDLDALASGEVVTAPNKVADSEYADAGLAEAALVAPAVSYAGVPKSQTVRGAYLRYFAAVAKSFVFLRKPGNIVTFIIFWLLLSLREISQTSMFVVPSFFAWGFLGMGWLASTGWYLAFKLHLVLWAAGEEEELPPLVADQGWLDDVVIPAYRILATYIFALLPVGIFFWMLIHRVENAIASNAAGMAPFVNPIPGPTAIIVLALLALAGVFAWPMLVLTVTCGGSTKAMFRLDLIGETVLKSLPAYLLTVIAVYVTCALQLGVTILIWNQVGPTTNWSTDWMAVFGVPMLLVGVSLYFDIIAMRAIGYYYACFKHKFAWSWG